MMDHSVVFGWVQEKILNCFVNDYIMILGRLSSVIGYVGPIEPNWPLLHGVRSDYDQTKRRVDIFGSRFETLARIVTAPPQLFQFCILHFAGYFIRNETEKCENGYSVY
jgi:hypothetical protein